MAGTGELEGRVAVVAGASRGIGRAVAIGLAARGARVAAAARTLVRRDGDLGGLDETVAEIEAAGGAAVPFGVDLDDPDDIDRLVTAVERELGPADILVNAAAKVDAPMYDTFDAMTVEEFHRQLRVNLVSQFALMKGFCPAMQARGAGRVINFTSGAALLKEVGAPLPGVAGTGAAYGASKAGVNRMTNALANELAPFGVLVVALDPGSTTTQMRREVATRFGFAAEGTHGADLPARAVVHLATCADPMRYAGRVLVARELVRELGLEG